MTLIVNPRRAKDMTHTHATESRPQAGRRMSQPGWTHAQTNGQPGNIMPQHLSTGWLESQQTDGRRTDTTDFITFVANTISNEYVYTTVVNFELFELLA